MRVHPLVGGKSTGGGALTGMGCIHWLGLNQGGVHLGGVHPVALSASRGCNWWCIKDAPLHQETIETRSRSSNPMFRGRFKSRFMKISLSRVHFFDI